MDDHYRLGGFASRGIEHVQVGHCGFGALFVARAKAESVFEAALHDLVGHTHIHDVRQVVFRCGLGCGQADGRGEGTDHCGHACLIHLLDFCSARLGLGLRIAQQCFQLGTAQRLDATGLVDVLDGHHRAFSALLSGIGQCAGHRVQDTHLDGFGLCSTDQRKSHGGRCSGRLGHEMAASTHGHSPEKVRWVGWIEGEARGENQADSMELGRQLFADPDLGIDAAYARQLHFVFVAVGTVQAVQPLHRTFLVVINQAAHGQQG